jgi:hypothetical protein
MVLKWIFLGSIQKYDGELYFFVLQNNSRVANPARTLSLSFTVVYWIKIWEDSILLKRLFLAIFLWLIFYNSLIIPRIVMACSSDFNDGKCLAASSKSWNMLLRCLVWMSGNAWPHPLSVWSCLATSYWNMVTCQGWEILWTGNARPHPLRVGICWDGLFECLEMLGRIFWVSLDLYYPPLGRDADCWIDWVEVEMWWIS